MKTVVVGAGPVGALAALYAARRGHEVEIYELRADLRDASTVPLNFTKSINLALSERGINAMRHADSPELLSTVLGETIPMHGRMIHGEANGKRFEQSQLYDAHGRYISAVDRGGLNKRLLDELEKMPNVKIFFEHRLSGADFNRDRAWFESRGPSAARPESNGRGHEVEVPFDLMIGADGAHSVVRYNLMKYTRMSYQQEYIDTLWCEFQMPPRATTAGPDFAIHPNRLHIWPGHDFMFIAIPSLDKTFTSTLFLPADVFATLDAQPPEKLVEFFQTHFPGVVPDLISEADLQSQYRRNPHLPLISIKCTPYHSGSSVVIIGDAAHAMVPFYGQGMNTGLEDVRVLFEFLDQRVPSLGRLSSKEPVREHLARALDEYTEFRRPDAHAIIDLARGNYQEMRSDVVSPVYKLRKYVEEWVSVHFPSTGWATQYSRVSFGNWRYSEVNRAAVRQKRVLFGVMGTVVGLTAATSFVLVGRSQLGPKAASAAAGLGSGLWLAAGRRFGAGH